MRPLNACFWLWLTLLAGAPTGCGTSGPKGPPALARPIDGKLEISDAMEGDLAYHPGDDVEFSGSYRRDSTAGVLPQPIVQLLDESDGRNKVITSGSGTARLENDVARFSVRFTIPREAKPGAYRAVARAGGVEFASTQLIVR